MAKEQLYTSFEVEDFINDEYFQDWVFGRGDERANNFWQEFLKSHSDKSAVIEQAVHVLKGIPFQTAMAAPEPPEEKIAAAFQQIIKTLGLKKGGRAKGRLIAMQKKWWVAAAVLLIIVSGGYFFIVRGAFDSGSGQVVQVPEAHDLLPGGYKAVLTLADGSQIVLDSAGNGVLTQQGNAKVIKLKSGQLAYNASGKEATKVFYNTVSTPRGGQYQVTLPDGTKVWLNSVSSLRFPTVFIGDERKVEITGEAYFEVAHNSAMPFRVSVNNMEVEVLGTHFNVNAYGDEGTIKTTLLQGSLKVSAEGASVLLKPGEQARLQTAKHELRSRDNVNVDEVMAWKNGLFYFDEAGIPQIMKKLSRWYDIDIEIESDVPDKKFNGKIYRNVNASEVFKILEAGGIHFKIIGKNVIVSK